MREEDVNQETEKDWKAEFDRLSWTEKRTLEFYAAALNVTEFMKEDTEKYPWRYPFYALYFVSWMSPYPPGVSTIMTLATVGFAMTRVNDYARRLNDSVTEAFNREALLETYKDHLVVDSKKPEELDLKVWSLTKHAMQKMKDDSWQATLVAKEEAQRVGKWIKDRMPML